MSNEKLTHDQSKKLAEFIYNNLNSYINEHYDAFLKFLEAEQKTEDKTTQENK